MKFKEVARFNSFFCLGCQIHNKWTVWNTKLIPASVNLNSTFVQSNEQWRWMWTTIKQESLLNLGFGQKQDRYTNVSLTCPEKVQLTSMIFFTLCEEWLVGLNWWSILKEISLKNLSCSSQTFSQQISPTDEVQNDETEDGVWIFEEKQIFPRIVPVTSRMSLPGYV